MQVLQLESTQARQVLLAELTMLRTNPIEQTWQTPVLAQVEQPVEHISQVPAVLRNKVDLHLKQVPVELHRAHLVSEQAIQVLEIKSE